MNRRNFMKSLLIGAAGSAGILPAFSQPAQPPASGLQPSARPNILVILADDLGYADVGFQGAKDIPTPNLDALAARSVRCTSGYVSHPFCSPTRAGLLTGRYQQRFGHENNPAWLPEDEKVGLPLTETTIANMLKAAGYATGMVGKWHQGAHPRFHPNRRGFDEYTGILGGGHQYLPGKPGTAEYTIPIDRNGKKEEHTEYLTDFFGREAAAFVGRHAGRPWFLYLAFNAPHTPLQALEKYLARIEGEGMQESRKIYAAMVAALDDAVGATLEAVRAAGALDNTLVFFLSDNGGPYITEPPFTHNAPLRGAKGQVYEGGIRVPFLVSWPARLRPGRDYAAPVIQLDILPTALAAAGSVPPAGLKLDGVNLLPYLGGEQAGDPHERLYWRTGGGDQFAVRQGRWKWVKRAGTAPELYDLAQDIGEKTDLSAADAASVAAELERASAAWNRELIPPLFQSPRPAAKKGAKKNAQPGAQKKKKNAGKTK